MQLRIKHLDLSACIFHAHLNSGDKFVKINYSRVHNSLYTGVLQCSECVLLILFVS